MVNGTFHSVHLLDKNVVSCRTLGVSEKSAIIVSDDGIRVNKLKNYIIMWTCES